MVGEVEFLVLYGSAPLSVLRVAAAVAGVVTLMAFHSSSLLLTVEWVAEEGEEELACCFDLVVSLLDLALVGSVPLLYL